jgi:uncharacterized protein with HEPN domain
MSKGYPLRVPQYLQHIIEAIERIEHYTAALNEAEFLDNTMAQDAVIRNVEIIGEACRNVERHHPDFATKHPQIPWGIAYEMRNALAHGYFQVDISVVWKTIRQDLPLLAVQIAALLKKTS